MKERRSSQRTSAAAIRQYLNKQGVGDVTCRSEVLRDQWVILVACRSMPHANHVWVKLRQGGYNLVGQFHTWIVVAEKQADEKGIM